MNNFRKIVFMTVLLMIPFLNYGQAIFGGSGVDISEAPYQVSLEIAGAHICGGVILNKNWIVTAAHCVKVSPDMIHAGATNQLDNSAGQRIGVKNIIIHPEWSGIETHGRDIALIELQSPLCFNENVKSIEYPSSSILNEGDEVFVTGWGKTESGSGSATLNGTGMNYMSDSDGEANFRCTRNTTFANQETIIFCEDHGQSSSGSGDSGGAVVFGDLLVGLVSFSCHKADPDDFDDFHHGVNSPAGFTDVGGLSAFINANITNGPLAECDCIEENLVDLHVNSFMHTDNQVAYGDVTIYNGGNLHIGGDNTMFMGDDKSITIKNGGSLILHPNAEISPCGEFWKKIIIEPGGSILGFNNVSFHSLKEGIVASENSSISLSNGGTLTGIDSDNSVGITILGKAEKVHIEDFIIDSYEGGIKCVDGESFYKIKNVTIDDAFTFGIHLDNSPCLILNSQIDCSNGDYAISIDQSAGTYLGFVSTSNKVLINESPNIQLNTNTITNPNFSGPGAALQIQNSNSVVIGYCDIQSEFTGAVSINSSQFVNCFGNSIFSNSSGFTGAVVSDLSTVFYQQNVINAPSTVLGGIVDAFSMDCVSNNNVINANSFGIIHYGSLSPSIHDNIVNANNGLFLHSSPDGRHECNYITSSDVGMKMSFNSEGQDFFANTLSGTNHDLEIDVVIGPQLYRGNEFLGGNPIANLSFLDINFSRFLVNPSYNFHMPLSPQPSSGWFNPGSDGDYHQCSDPAGNNTFWTENEMYCEFLNHLIDQYDIESTQVANFLLNAERILGLDIEELLLDCENVNLIIENKGAYKSIIEIEDMLFSTAILEGEVAFALNMENYLNIEFPTENDFNVLKIAVENMQSNLNNYLVTQNNDLLGMISILEGLVIQNNEILEVERAVLLEYLEYKTTENEAFDYTVILNYARYCADKYGRIIHLARIVAKDVSDENFLIYDICAENYSEFAQSTSTVASIIYNVHPNPSYGTVHINFEEQFTGSIFVKNLSGQNVESYKVLERDNIKIDLSQYSGLYFIELIDNEGGVEAHKIVIKK